MRLESNRVRVGERFSFSLQRTLRIPDDGRLYPLPPGLGRLPVHAAADYADRVPSTWRTTNTFFVPVHQREALWIGFDAPSWKPNAVKVGVGRVSAVTGESWDEQLHADPQDYLVCPPQLWLDGINAGSGFVRQFVSVPLGLGQTVEGQITGSEAHGGIQIAVFEAAPGRFPDEPPAPSSGTAGSRRAQRQAAQAMLGLGAGGTMSQKVYPDPHGIDVWDHGAIGVVIVHLVNTVHYQMITGCAPPPSPVNAHTYTAHGLPWFELYDERFGDLPPSPVLEQVNSVQAIARRDHAISENDPLDIREDQIKRLGDPED